MEKVFCSDFKLGILGGGQLGRMLIQEAVNFNIQTSVLDPDADAPCKSVCNYFENGSLQDFDTVYRFGKKVNLLTIEFEHVNVDALKKLQQEGLTVYPQPDIITMVQDKGLQKQFYKQNNIPSAAFRLFENRHDIENANLTLPFIQKSRKAGYDGKGVVKINSISDYAKAFDVPSVVEELIDFEKEISVIVARNVKGEIACFPVVELEFNPEANLVEYLFSPAQISKDVEQQAEKVAFELAAGLKLVGILAVEMFVTKDGQVLVNEIAPRPHNSGHHTIEANFTSQYEQHLRAIFNWPLGSTDIITPAVMVNLLGEQKHEGLAFYEGLEEVLSMKGINIHLYGKRFTKPFRKMGHVTVIDPDIANAREKAFLVKKTLKVISK